MGCTNAVENRNCHRVTAIRPRTPILGAPVTRSTSSRVAALRSPQSLRSISEHSDVGDLGSAWLSAGRPYGEPPGTTHAALQLNQDIPRHVHGRARRDTPNL